MYLLYVCIYDLKTLTQRDHFIEQDTKRPSVTE